MGKTCVGERRGIVAVAAGLGKIKGHMVGRAGIIHLMADVAVGGVGQKVVIKQSAAERTGVMAIAADAGKVHPHMIGAFLKIS